MRTISLTLVAVWGVCNCSPAHAQQEPKAYPGYHADPIAVDGILNKAEWKHATLVSDFIYAWEEDDPPPTAFYAQTDDSFFNFAFKVRDKDIVLYDFSKELDVAE